MTAAAFQATVHSLRTVAGRKVVQIVVEAPIEHLPTIARIAEHGSWVAVARLQVAGSAEDSTAAIEPDTAAPDSELSRVPARRNFVLSQKAYLLCEKPSFAKFLVEKYKHRLREGDSAATFLRGYCGVNSRANILPGTAAADKFYQIDSEFTAWERVA